MEICAKLFQLTGVLLFIAVRAILFVLIWSVTMGKIYFWLFPNLNEDLGVIESFKPLYSLKKRKVKKSKKNKQSADSNETETTAVEKTVEVIAETTVAETTADSQEVHDDNT